MAVYVNNTRPSIRPSLSLDFANSKTVDNRITFTRASASTYFNPNGVLQYAVNNKPRIDHDPNTGDCKGLLIEESRTNIYLYTTAMSFTGSGGWNGYGVSASPTNATLAPDGTLSATKLTVLSGSNTYGQYYVYNPPILSASTTYTVSVYAKAAGYNYVRLAGPYNSGYYLGAQFNLSTGAVVTGVNGAGYSITNTSMTAVGNGWYRLTMTFVPGSGAYQPSVTICPNSTVWDGASYSGYGSTGDGVSGCYAWGMQVEAASFATSYIPSTDSFTSRASSATYFDSTGVLRIAGNNQARYGYAYDSSSGNWISQGLVLEPAATNQISNSYPMSFYSTSNASAADTTGPDGNISAKRVTYSSNSSAYVTIAFPNLTGTYVFSVWMKKVSGSPSNGLYAYQGPGVSPTTQSWGSGSLSAALSTTVWTRVWGIFTFAGGSTGNIVFPGYDAGNGVVIDYAFPQLESGTVPTSFIPTSGATATRSTDVGASSQTTRAADYAKLSLSGIVPEMPSQLSPVIDFETFAPAGSSLGVFGFTGLGQTNWGAYSYNESYWKTYESNTGYAITYLASFAQNTKTKIAQTWAAGAGAANYAINQTSNSTMSRAVGKLNTLTLGYVAYDWQLNGWIRQFRIYSTALSATNNIELSKVT